MSIPNGYIERVQEMDNYYPRLRDLREDHDLSQQQVAEYLGMKQPQYNRYERGLRDVPTDVLIRLAKLYQTSTDYILGLTNRSRKSNK
jgi:transcriptional regulator with XRE-family HTH domain